MSQVFQVADEILVRQARAHTFPTENTKWTGFMIVFQRIKTPTTPKKTQSMPNKTPSIVSQSKEDAKKYAKIDIICNM